MRSNTSVLSFNRARRGAMTVEFALVLPIIFLLFFAAVEFTRLTMLKHLADNASFEACRHVIVPGANMAEAQARANSILNVLGVTNATLTFTPNPILESTTNVTVQVSIPAAGNLWMVPSWSGGTLLVSETTLLTERAPIVQVTGVPGPPPPPPPPPAPAPPPEPPPPPPPPEPPPPPPPPDL